ncbi:MAG: 3,4-dihydroxy 2-butanone 4-phosphate synthase/GTP cyclohydrolase II [Alphaproteobacteria bacterium]|jgi:3,4-dihydroxy 2-butanone 4-phosphate synthase/GTP cyclohydrolase II
MQISAGSSAATSAESEKAQDEGLDSVSFPNYKSSIEEIIEEARNGRMFILVDDEDRENEGDLVIPAQMATPEVVNFMAMHGRGLICLSLTRDRIQSLGLSMLPQQNSSRLETAFTVSIEAREGVTTGISAPDRARTIAVAIDPSKGPGDIATPGHVFPLLARDGGVLVRTGHTEASVDIARLAGLNPSGLICEIMNDDGTMARREDLVQFAQFHGLKIGTIADLIAYRRRHDRTVNLIAETSLNSRYGGDWAMQVFANTVPYAENVALVKGDISGDEPVLVRMHAINLFDDVLSEADSDRAGALQASMQLIGEAGRGVVVVIREWYDTMLSDRVHTRNGDLGKTSDQHKNELRDYGVGAQILLELGVKDLILLSNAPKKIIGIDGYGLNVVDHQSIPGLKES